MTATATEEIQRDLRELRERISLLREERAATLAEIGRLRQQGEKVADGLADLLLKNERRLVTLETGIAGLVDRLDEIDERGTRGGETKAEKASRELTDNRRLALQLAISVLCSSLSAALIVRLMGP